MTCHTCISNKDHVVIGQSNGQRIPGILIILADHTFPAAIPATSSAHCAKIIRLELGSLSELADEFARVFKKAKLPPGSLILLGSPSYLDRVGLTCYTKSLVEVILAIRRAKPGTLVGPLPPHPA